MLKCNECGNELETDIGDDTAGYKSFKDLGIFPCGTCIDKTEEEAEEKGFSKGEKEGIKEGIEKGKAEKVFHMGLVCSICDQELEIQFKENKPAKVSCEHCRDTFLEEGKKKGYRWGQMTGYDDGYLRGFDNGFIEGFVEGVKEDA